MSFNSFKFFCAVICSSFMLSMFGIPAGAATLDQRLKVLEGKTGHYKVRKVKKSRKWLRPPSRSLGNTTSVKGVPSVIDLNEYVSKRSNNTFLTFPIRLDNINPSMSTIFYKYNITRANTNENMLMQIFVTRRPPATPGMIDITTIACQLERNWSGSSATTTLEFACGGFLNPQFGDQWTVTVANSGPAVISAEVIGTVISEVSITPPP